MGDPTEERPGAWFVYGVDWDDYPIGLYATELEARRHVVRCGRGFVAFWPFGKEWTDVQ